MKDPESARPLPATQHITSCDSGSLSPENADESYLCFDLSPITFLLLLITRCLSHSSFSFFHDSVLLAQVFFTAQSFIAKFLPLTTLCFPRSLGYAELTTKSILKPALKVQKPELPKPVRRTVVVQSLTSYQTNKKNCYFCRCLFEKKTTHCMQTNNKVRACTTVSCVFVPPGG